MYFILIFFIASLYIHSQKSIHTLSELIKNKTIIIDAGHGIPDCGALAKDGTKEMELNLQIARKVKKILQEKGFNIIMTRNNNYSLSKSETNNKRSDLSKRKSIVANSDGDIFISIHMNYFPEEKYSGAQVFFNECMEENSILATSIQNNLIEIADPDNTRSSKADNSIYILKNSPIPSVLIECGFLSNSGETEKLKTKEYQNRLTKAIYFGIIKYFKQAKK